MKGPSHERPEDPELTREILFYCARDRADKPGNITLEELERAFSWISRSPLKDQVKFAIDLELLGVVDMQARRLGGNNESQWVDILDLTLSGLTPKGREYVKRARTPAWRKPLDRIKESGQEVTTALLLKRLAGILDT